MINSIAVCGDSFGTGEGLPDDTKFSLFFGGLVSKYFGLSLKIYARQGCCNFVIYLQVKKIIDDFRYEANKPLVLISTTHHERYTIPTIENLQRGDLALKNVDYKSYPPYNKIPLPFEQNDIKLFSQTLHNMLGFLQNRNHGAYSGFDVIKKEKIEKLVDYVVMNNDSEIKREYDIALITKMHSLLKHHKIPHIILINNLDGYEDIDFANKEVIDWGLISRIHPDKIGSGHCNEEGHKLVFNSIINKCSKIINA